MLSFILSIYLNLNFTLSLFYFIPLFLSESLILACFISYIFDFLSSLRSFRFIVNPTANSLEPCFYDPDSTVPWVDIDCVIVPHTTPPMSEGGVKSTVPQEQWQGRITTPGGPCPICLRALRIPKMTKCGHLFWFVPLHNLLCLIIVIILIISSTHYLLQFMLESFYR